MRTRWSIWRTGLVALFALPYLAPLLFVVAISLRPAEEYIVDPLGFPSHVTTSHYAAAWNDATMGSGMINSLVVSMVAVVSLLAISSLAAYWFERHRGRRARVLLAVIAGAWVFPFVVYLVPLFVILSTFRLTNNLIVLGIVYGATTAPFALYLHHAYYQRIPHELTEAALVDGATSGQLFLRVFLPLSKPILAAIAALGFLFTWGDVLLGLILIQDSAKYPVTIGVALITKRFDANFQENAAAAVLLLLPVLVVFLIFQKEIRRGLTLGTGT